MGLFGNKLPEKIKTAKELMELACNDCQRRNGYCTDENCGIRFLKMVHPNYGHDWVLGTVNSETLDSFWVGYTAGHMADTLTQIEQRQRN